VIAPGFGVHFLRNSLKNGLLPVTLPEVDVADLAQAVLESRGRLRIAIDLEAQTVRLDGVEALRFAIEPEAKIALLQGLDDIGQTQRRTAAIEGFQDRDRAQRPWVYLDGQ
jgi:3-isopropylmalate/(R)-2-methylmalate dehydratase small subunit